jgi:signal transduction histidine kinase
MTPEEHLERLWLSYLVAAILALSSIFLWYVLWQHLDAFMESLQESHKYIPWIVLVVGLCISILVGGIIRVGQLAWQRTRSLNHSNDNLKKEIQERIHAEETKQKLEVALLQGQKLQAMGTLAGGIAHDFNNILYAIIGYVEMAREDVEKDSLIYKNLGKVLEGSHRGQELIARILSFSRRQHHQFNEINLHTTLEAALSLLRPTIPASVMIHFNAKEGPSTILGNQTQIHQVLVNLINNAVDAMDGEGSININLSKVLASDELLKQFPGNVPQDYFMIEISDTGHGIDQQTMERMFEPFFTTKEVGKGTGLGLSIVHTIIKEHHGEIIVNSQLGHGTTLTILLPEYAPET